MRIIKWSGFNLASKVVLGALLILTSCAYNSSYQPPPLAVSQQWTVANHNLTTTSNVNLPYVAWWQGFNDPLLSSLIESSLLVNNSLNMSRASIQAAEGELKRIQFGWVPDLNLLLGYSNNPATGFPGLLALIAPSYTINLFSQFKQQKKAEYELAAAKAEDDALKLTLIAQVSASYFTYLAEIEHKRLLQTLATDLNHLTQLATKLYQSGISSDINVEQFQAQLAQIRGEQEVIEQNIIFSRNSLRYLINQNPGELQVSPQTWLQLNNKQIIPGQLPLTVLEQRPDMQLAENQLRAANEGIGIAASQLLPTLQLDYIGGPTAATANGYNFPSPLLQNSVNFNDEILRIPAFKLSALGAIAQAKGLNKAAYYNYMDTLQKVLRDTTNAIAANEKLTNKFNQSQSAGLHLTKAYNLNQSLYQKGIQSYMQTLNSKIALDQMQITINQDKLQQLITVVRLYQELAGGYKAFESNGAAK